MQPVSKTTEQQILEWVPGKKTSRMTNRKPCRKSCYRKSGREKKENKEKNKQRKSAPGLQCKTSRLQGSGGEINPGSTIKNHWAPGLRRKYGRAPGLRGPPLGGLYVVFYFSITATSQLLWGWFGKNIQLSQIDYIPHYLHYKTHRENNWIQYFISHFLHWNNWRLS